MSVPTCVTACCRSDSCEEARWALHLRLPGLLTAKQAVLLLEFHCRSLLPSSREPHIAVSC